MATPALIAGPEYVRNEIHCTSGSVTIPKGTGSSEEDRATNSRG